MWPNIIIKDQNYHPQPQKWSGAAQMGHNMTKKGTKNSLNSLKPQNQHLGPSISVEIPLITICVSI
jgi:hypothetical protein